LNTRINNCIKNKTLEDLRNWLTLYVKNFYSQDSRNNLNIKIKEEHTFKVCDEMESLVKSNCSDPELMYVAGICALFHDIGRFEQYKKYGTFSDMKSEDHAALGVSIIRQEGILDFLDKEEYSLILRAISYHNRAQLPEDETADCLLLTKLIRDADKIDIWRVVCEYYSGGTVSHNSTIQLDLPEEGGISDEVMDDIRSGRIVKNGKMKTVDDLKALQMGWVFDINFSHTFKLLRERGYMEELRDSISDRESAEAIYNIVNNRIERETGGIEF